MSNANNESMLRATSSDRMAASQRDKRKSEVLIAAQSLDNEIRSVKNLKRLSIGSMDLLIDPELDIKFGGGSNGRRSWCGASSISTPAPNGTATGMNNTRYSDPTPLENLHEQGSPKTEPSVKSKQSSYIGHKKGVHSPSRKLNANALKKNLLWVPANQHPNVKPDNYLELVQDTLQNIQLSDDENNDDKNNDNEKDEAPGEIKSYCNKENINTVDLNRSTLKHGNTPLVRRPSTLRRSYTELDNNEDENVQGDDDFKAVNKVEERTHKTRERPVSLRDITEELTKISNSAGLTNNDAITLARTLSMAGSYSDKGDEPRSKDPKNNYEDKNIGVASSHTETLDDGEYASNMQNNNDTTRPERSSLKRSRFNTYRIRSQESEEQDVEATKDEEAECLLVTKNASKVGIDSPKSPFKQEDEESENMSSPGSIGDFQDIYDHYRQSSGDWEQEMRIEKEKEELVADKVENELVKQELTLEEEPADIIKLSTAEDSKETKRHRRRNGWSWLNNKMNKEDDNEENQGDDENEDNVDSQKMERDNSKKHHIALFNGGEKTESLNKEEVDDASVPTATSQTRQKIEKTLANLFRRKTHHKHEAPLSPSPSPSLSPSPSASPSPPIPNSDAAPVPGGKFKKLGSKNGREPVEPIVLHNRPRHHRHHHTRHSSREISVKGFNGTQSQLQSQLKARPQQQQPLQLQLEDEIDRIEVKREEESDSESLPKLQPAVSVSSTKSNPRDTEEVEAKKQNKKKKRHNTTGFVNEQRAEPALRERGHEQKTQEQTLAQEQEQEQERAQEQEHALAQSQSQSQSQEQEQAQAPTAPPLRHTSVLPPRKLTFADVKKPDQPNAPVQFTDSAFGFPLPLLTVSTVIMFDHRLPINVERAIYRLSHLKLSNSKRGLREQVLLSNFMYAYLNLVNHTLYMEQVAHDKEQQQI